jgi:hypothetical protein
MVLLVGAVAAQQPPAGQGAPAGRGGGGAAQGPTNLKVLPSTWSGQQVRNLMQTFNESLGVQCSYCHSPDPNAAPAAPGGRGPALNYALDLKEEKEIARKMIQMNASINETLKAVGDPAMVEKASCYTCHQGNAVPKMTPEGGWGRGGFSLLPAGPPARGGGAAPAPGGGGRGN